MGKEHYSKRTVEVSAWCKKHGRNTAHSVHDGRKGSCLECMKDLEEKHKAAPEPPAEQLGMFGGNSEKKN